MSVRLRPYPTYKDSEYSWLGQLPLHWESGRLKRACRFGYGDSLASDSRESGHVPVYGSNGRVGTHSTPNTLGPCVIVGRKGSFGKVNYSAESAFAIDTTFFIDRRLTREDLRWLYYVLSWARLDDASRDSAVPGLDRGEAYQRVIPIPPRHEQASIAGFLDSHDRRINRLIRAKRRLSELLNEQKQAIIHRAVTRGLDPNVRLKPSGIDWFGDVPEHWEVKKLKYIVPQVTVGIVIQPASLYVPDGAPCLRSLNISSGKINPERLVFISPESNQQHRKSRLRAGDIVVVRTGAAGVAAIVTPEFDGANCIDLLVIRQGHQIDSNYLLLYLNSTAARRDVEYNSVGAIQAHYNTTTLANLLIPLPSRQEQISILERLNSELRPVDAAIGRTRREIDLLREYRTRLIADVVTGKLDVRGVDLPPLDEDGTLEDTDLADEAELDEAADSEDGGDAGE